MPAYCVYVYMCTCMYVWTNGTQGAEVVIRRTSNYKRHCDWLSKHKGIIQPEARIK